MATSRVGDTATSTPLLAAAPATGRKGASVFNDSSAILYLLLGQGTASATNYTVQVASGELWESPDAESVIGGLSGVWASDAGGGAQVTDW